MKTTLLTCLACFISLLSHAQPYGTAGEMTKVTPEMTDAPYPFVEYLPEGYDGTTKYPLLFTFSGLGEKGSGSISDLQKVISPASALSVVHNGGSFDAVVISPQSSTAYFNPTQIKSIYDWVLEHYAIDTDRFYVIGLSAGGQNAVLFTEAYPELVAAIVAICPAAAVANGSDYLKTIPWWSHHNFDDGTTPITRSNENFNRISGANLNPIWQNRLYPHGPNETAASDDYTIYMDLTIDGGDTTVKMSGEYGVKEPKQFHAFTVYKSGGHNAWTKTFANPDVWDWMFRQSKTGTVTSTKKALDIQLEIYPNPSSSTVQVIIPSAYLNKVVAVQLINTLGEAVRTVTSNISQQVDFNVSELASGLYTVIVETEKDTISQKVVIK